MDKNPNAKKINQYDMQGKFIRQWNCMKEITNECYQNGTSVEYMVKYRFVGSEESFNIIKTFSQNVLDGTLKRDKNNATIFGKKIII